MRRILIDNARRKRNRKRGRKRGSGRQRLDLDDVPVLAAQPSAD
jgi:hypothetical protein